MRKTNIIIVITLVLAVISSPVANALNIPDSQIPIDIMVNGSFIKTDASPYIEYDTTFVPIRFVSEALGAKVEWDAPTATASILYGNTTIHLTEGKNIAYVNGQPVKLNKHVRITRSRTFVPVRFVAESLGARVDWDGTLCIVKIAKGSVAVSESMIQKNYTEDDILWLARIIEAESAGEPMEGKIAVGNVVLNRVNSPDFPNTIYGVIFDTNNGVQYEPVINRTIYNSPSLESVVAAKRTLRGENYVGDSLFFFNPVIAVSSWISENRTYYTTIAHHAFYL